MEALIAFGVNWKLLLIQGVNFGLLLLLLYRFLYKPLFALLEKRQQAIERGLHDAEEATREKEAIQGAKEHILHVAQEEGGKIVDALRKQAVAQEREILHAAQEKSSAVVSEAIMKANDEREHILHEAEKDIARMAVLATEKILRGQPHNA